jgi:hypothetical protein
MTRDEKQAELERHKIIIDATIDFLLLYDTGKFVFDGRDGSKESYKRQQAEAEKNFNNSNINKLEQQLLKLTNSLRYRPSLDSRSYIQEQTGYDFDVFAANRENFEKVVAKGHVDNEIECNDVCIMLSHLRIDEKEIEDIYAPMLEDFHQRQMAKIESSPELKKKYDEHHEIIEKDGEQIEIFYSHGKPPHHKTREELSPNGIGRLCITEDGHEDHSSTSIHLNFELYGCGVYSVEGIHPEINAFWKDNQTIVIETKGHESQPKYKKIEIYGNVFAIEYIET